MKKYKIVTLGCRTNQYESQVFSNQLQKGGCQQAHHDERAEICIVNTCSVTQSADKRSLCQTRKLLRENNPEKLIVTGCSAENLKEMPGVTHVVPNMKKEHLLPLVFPEREWSEFRLEQFDAHTRAFVKIQDGCNSFCSYCIIPFVRGRSRSKSISDIVKEVVTLVKNGYKEVVLTGVNIGNFGKDQIPKVSLADLIYQVDRVEGLKRLRLSSIDPNGVDDELINVMLSGRRVCPSLHISLQSGSNLTLKRMGRKYTRQEFLDIITKLLEQDPDFTFTTDLIIGFPGETTEEFKETLQLIEQGWFANAHLFPYSNRPYTSASKMSNQVPKSVIEEQKQQLYDAQRRASFRLRNRYVGRKFEVLVEMNNRGYTKHFLPVSIPEREIRPNEMVGVKCVKNQREGLVGYIYDD